MATIDLLLVGRTGNGKSSTGNSILDSKVFTPRGISSAKVVEIYSNSATIGGRKITVVDGIDIEDSSIDGPRNVQDTNECAKKAMERSERGFAAILLVLKYGVRFTNQEKEAVRIIKQVLGDNVLRTHGIVVMTHGDNFNNDAEENGMTFESWCEEQTGDVQELFKECGYRHVKINNRTKDPNQIILLMSKVDQVSSRGSPYTMENFKLAEPGRKKLLVQSKLPELQKKTTSVLEYVTKNLHKMEDSYYSPSDYIRELDGLKREIDSLKSFLDREDEGTKSISQLLLQISITETSISTKKERHQRKIELERELEKQEIDASAGGKNNSKLKIIIFCGVVSFVVIAWYLLW